MRGCGSGQRGGALGVKDEVERWLGSITGVTCYPEKMKVYAPTCRGKCLPAVERLVKRLNELFGGSTVYDAEGTWTSPEGRVEREPVKVIEVAHHCTDPEAARRFAEALVDYAVEAKQEAMAVSQGSFYIAPTPELVEGLKRLRMRRA
jgi:hypothetical protein